MQKIKIKQLTSGAAALGQYLVADGNSGFTYTGITEVNGIDVGTSFPLSPESGDVFYRTDVDELYHYDDSRSKWLTVTTSMYTCGRDQVKKNVTAYMLVGSAPQTSTVGFNMKQNGTLISATLDNSDTATSTRLIEIRINNSTVNKVTLSLTSGNKSVLDNSSNLDFSSGDKIQVVAIADGTNDLDNVIVTFEVAWRP